MLIARSISKSFPGVRALDDVDFAVHSGEIHALLGENGAGKSTLIKIITGVHQPDAGAISLNDEIISPRTPLEAQRLGISTVYQELDLVPTLSVADNICLGREPTRLGVMRRRRMRQSATGALRRLGLDLDVHRHVASLPAALRQMVAIARAIDLEARVLILDEPTSSLDASEKQRLFDVLRRLREQGLAIIFITHFLEEVDAVADRLTVLRNGRVAGVRETTDTDRLQIVALMLGMETAAAAELMQHRETSEPRSEPREFLRARGIGRHRAVEPLDLDVRRGEILGLAGLLGSGRTELARLLFGADRLDRGSIEIEGKRVRRLNPRRAAARGLGMCPEDRQVEGIIPNLSVRENIMLALQARRGWFGKLSRAAQQEIADRLIRTLRIAVARPAQPVRELSGGNQQKVILARWLAAEPRLLIVDEPTRGVDVGAKLEIERLLRRLCREGLGVLFISSELEEIVRNSDRVAVMRDRRKVGELEEGTIEVDRIMVMIAGEGGGGDKGRGEGDKGTR